MPALSSAPLTRTALARIIDHTLLRPEATPEQVVELCEEALELGVGAVCVSPSYVRLAVEHVGDEARVATVVAFPSGASRTAIKVAEAALACREGADEVDMVMDLGFAMSGHWSAVEGEISAVRREIPGTLKVILETSLLPADAIETACRVADAAGADYVKTSTGFHPAGGASVEAVRLMADTVGNRLGVKASGGIRTAEQALAMVAAGATRLGISASRAVLAGFPEESITRH
jgi:deoxyribose-phosphate aldolase